MANVILNTTFQIRRGNAEVWKKNNPILSKGEPAFVVDENRLKIGDGVTPWNNLPYVGEANVINAPTHYDFPSIGRPDVIYKSENEKQIYQWNTAELKYELLCGTVDPTLDIEIINGGNANG